MQPNSAAMPRGTAQVSVIIDGTQQPLFRRADGRLFAAGVPGRPYTLRVRNTTGGRIEMIVTVDGRHVLKDEPGDLQACHGLVIPAYGDYDFQGWRISDDQTREFLFGEPAVSVAARATGSTANIGVLGFAAWREKSDFYLGSIATASAGPPVTYGAASGEILRSANVSARGTLGTGIGALQDDHVGRTDFTRTGSPDILVIGYDTETVLRERGIIGSPDPIAFPGTATGYEKYATHG